MAYPADPQQQQSDYVSVNNTVGDIPSNSEPRGPQSGGGFQPHSGPPPGLGGTAFVPGKIFIGGLDGTTTKETLQDYCAQWGEMSDIVLMEGRGFGFVTYSDPQSAQQFLERREHEIDGKKVEAKAAVPKNAGGSSGLTRKMFVGGTGDINEEDFRAHFAQFGDIEDCVILRKPDGTSRGFGFVTYREESMVEKCLVVQHTIGGKTVEVKRAVKKEDMALGAGYDQSYAARTGKAPDWHCPDCKNKNFGWREVCNRCQSPKPQGMPGPVGIMGSGGMMGGVMGGMRGYMGGSMGGGEMGMSQGYGMGGMGSTYHHMNGQMANMGEMGGYGGGNMGTMGAMANMGGMLGYGGGGGLNNGVAMGGRGGMGGYGGGNMHGNAGMAMGGGMAGMQQHFAGASNYQSPAANTGYGAGYGEASAGYDGGRGTDGYGGGAGAVYSGGAGAATGGYAAAGQQGGYGGGAGAGAGGYGGGAGAGGTGYGNAYASGSQQGGYEQSAGYGPQQGYHGRAAPGRGGPQRYRPY